MIDNLTLILALRTLAQGLSVTTTGSTALVAVATGYTRAAGSFVTDGFVVGQEVTPVGFTQTTPCVIGAVTAGALTIIGGRTAESPASATLTAGFPALRAWENVAITPTSGRWYAEDDYVPGPAQQVTLGPLGEIETLPLYTLKLYGMENTGVSALFKAADALLKLFAPRTVITVASGSSCVVRTTPAPSLGQLIHADPGWSCLPVTIPLRYRTPNSN